MATKSTRSAKGGTFTENYDLRACSSIDFPDLTLIPSPNDYDVPRPGVSLDVGSGTWFASFFLKTTRSSAETSRSTAAEKNLSAQFGLSALVRLRSAEASSALAAISRRLATDSLSSDARTICRSARSSGGGAEIRIAKSTASRTKISERTRKTMGSLGEDIFMGDRKGSGCRC